MWEVGGALLLSQLDNIGPSRVKNLLAAGISSFAQLATADAKRIEAACHRNAPYGSILKSKAAAIPQFHIGISKVRHTF